MKSHAIKFFDVNIIIIIVKINYECSLFQAFLEYILIISCYLHDSFVENMYPWFQTNKLCSASNF